MATRKAEGENSMRGLLRNLEEAKADVQNGLYAKMAGKPFSMQDIHTLYDSNLTDEEKKFIRKLGRFTAPDLWDNGWDEDQLGKKFTRQNMPQWFVLELEVRGMRKVRASVLVDTEDYDYIRYAARLER